MWNHSQVTCVLVHPLHLEVLDDGADSTQWCTRPAKGHLVAPDAVFHLFFRSTVVVMMISTLTESLCMIIACCCLGTEQACCLLLLLLFWIWRIFHGNILNYSWGEYLSRYYWQLLDSRPSDSSSFNVSVVFTVRAMCAYCKIIIIQFIRLVEWCYTYIFMKPIGSVVDSRQLPHRDQMGAIMHWISFLKFFVIREAQWGSPDQLCCPCTDKWFPLFKKSHSA